MSMFDNLHILFVFVSVVIHRSSLPINCTPSQVKKKHGGITQHMLLVCFILGNIRIYICIYIHIRKIKKNMNIILTTI
jgi:hypothetical protein